MFNRRTLLGTLGTTGILSVFPSTAYAHRQKKAQSNIEWNARTSSLEITHRLHRHDAAQALAALGKIEAPDLTSLKSRAILALHLAEQFSIRDISNKPIELEIIGAENSGPHIFAYFEAKLKNPPQGLVIENTILHDVYGDQINHVNIRFNEQIKSALFARGDKAKKVLA